MDIYISFIDIILDPSSCHEIKKKTPWGSWQQPLGSATPKPYSGILGWKPGTAEAMDLIWSQRERERGMWPDYLRETCELQVSSAKHIKFDSKQKTKLYANVRQFSIHCGVCIQRVDFQQIDFQWFPVSCKYSVNQIWESPTHEHPRPPLSCLQTQGFGTSKKKWNHWKIGLVTHLE